MFLLIIGPLLSVDATSVVGAIVVISALVSIMVDVPADNWAIAALDATVVSAIVVNSALVSIMVDVAADNWAIAATTVVGAIVVFSAEFRSWLMWVEHF